MKELLSRLVAGIRSWIGWGDIDETRLSPEHGWLLPTSSAVGVPARAVAAKPARRE
jgi:hypothetical protein